jgi:predicted alpha/beta hydrolase
MAERVEITRIRTEDDAELVVEQREPRGRARAVVLLSHAMMASRRSLDRPRGQGLASTLVDAGFRVLLADLRGHGDARTAKTTRDGWTYDDLVRYDAPALARHARARAEGMKVIAVGHSLFGHVSLCARGLGLMDVDAIAVLGANTWERDAEPSRLRRALKRASMTTVHGITRVFGRLPVRALGLGSDDEPEAYFRQFARWMRDGRYDSMDRRDDYARAVAAVDVPVLAIGSEGDRVLAPVHHVEAFVRRIRDHRVVILRGEGAPSHMELGCALPGLPAWRAVIAFVDDQTIEPRDSRPGSYSKP